MSADPSSVRVSRFYTAARRHPWVLGKVGDWRIPLGPYTPAQIVLAVGGGFLLVKTIGWWSWLGPIPLAALILAIWTVRRPTIAGRAVLPAALGWLLLACQPGGGRVGGRAARDRAPRTLTGGFTLEAAPAPACETAPAPPAAAGPAADDRRSSTRFARHGCTRRQAEHTAVTPPEPKPGPGVRWPEVDRRAGEVQ